MESPVLEVERGVAGNEGIVRYGHKYSPEVIATVLHNFPLNNFCVAAEGRGEVHTSGDGWWEKTIRSVEKRMETVKR